MSKPHLHDFKKEFPSAVGSSELDEEADDDREQSKSADRGTDDFQPVP